MPWWVEIDCLGGELGDGMCLDVVMKGTKMYTNPGKW